MWSGNMTNSVDSFRVYFKRLHSKAKMPTYATMGDAACDLYSVKDYVIKPGKWLLVRTGFAMEMGSNSFEAQIRPRSSLAVKHGVTVLNSPGTIDWGYRGEVKVVLINHGDKDFAIKEGDRIAQMKFALVFKGIFIDVGEKELSLTERSDGGFGSTGK